MEGQAAARAALAPLRGARAHACGSRSTHLARALDARIRYWPPRRPRRAPCFAARCAAAAWGSGQVHSTKHALAPAAGRQPAQEGARRAAGATAPPDGRTATGVCGEARTKGSRQWADPGGPRQWASRTHRAVGARAHTAGCAPGPGGGQAATQPSSAQPREGLGPYSSHQPGVGAAVALLGPAAGPTQGAGALTARHSTHTLRRNRRGRRQPRWRLLECGSRSGASRQEGRLGGQRRRPRGVHARE